MADKGFTVENLLPLGVSLNIPPFLGSKGQMSPQEVVETKSVAFLRIHMERGINKIKNFHIWDSIVPFTMFGVVNQMWSVCAMLCNFQNSIISVAFKPLHPQNQTLCHEPNLGSITVRVSMQMGIPR